MQDGLALLTYNRQGGPRGGQDFGSQNWWMGMAQRPAGTGTLQRAPTFSAAIPYTAGWKHCRPSPTCCASARTTRADIHTGTKNGLDEPFLSALTLGGVRMPGRWSGWDLGAGGDVTFYGVPDILKPTHGDNPVSFHVFVRVRPPAPMGRMVDMIMTRGH